MNTLDDNVVPITNDTPAEGAGNDSGSGAAAPAASPGTASPGAGGPMAAPEAGAAPTAQAAPAAHHNPAQKILQTILGALGGTEETQMERDPETGKMVVTATKSGPGQQWKKIIAGAITGAAAGASVKPGPGHLGRSGGAGVEAGMKLADTAEQSKIDSANQNFDAEQKVQVRKAQVAHINQTIAQSAWQMTREKADFAMKNTEMAASFHNLVTSGGGEDFGVYPSFTDFLEKHGGNGAQIGKMNANMELRAMPEFDKDGKLAGVHVYKITPGWNEQKNLEDAKIDMPKLAADGTLQHDIQTIAAGSSTNGDILTKQQAATKMWMDAAAKTQVTPKEKFKEAEEDKRENVKANATVAAANARAAGSDDKAATASYKFHTGELNKIQTPIDQLVGRMGRLVDTMNQKSPQADALVAPELLTVMAGGQGSGLRMSEAEIARIVGGRSHWEDLKGAIQKWDTDPKSARSITPEQDRQIRALITEVNAKMLAKQKTLNTARQVLASSDDPQEHKNAYLKARTRLNVIDAGGATEDGMVRFISSDGFPHDIPEANLDEAKRRDPKLKVIGQ